MMANFSDAEREIYGKLADYLIPSWKDRPAATSVGVHRHMLDEVLRIRPDLEAAFQRAIARCPGQDISKELNALAREDNAAWTALTTVTTGGYMMTDEARAAVGYPGQVAPPYDPNETPEYVTNGMLDRVKARGPIFRDTRHLS
ncbi:hypothetical protein EET67_00850 [Pseudaminobacter arsenicus]|uniref:Gluconate 2-dehydrogenase subunit 3 family protein n=1 Tax=Borborobacter arsenicus TaxID=1851146 RepID=A0A432VBE2_9HYPH|nr:hypothetical protein [Pseudaminobacter arsenicus]RUM99491.1 hypothetical protein EET67_00850 [Pseudaminobacter arsenicus]